MQGLGEGTERLGDAVLLLAATTAAVAVIVADWAGVLLLLLSILLDIGEILLGAGEVAVLKVLRQGVEGLREGIRIVLRLRGLGLGGLALRVLKVLGERGVVLLRLREIACLQILA